MVLPSHTTAIKKAHMPCVAPVRPHREHAGRLMVHQHGSHGTTNTSQCRSLTDGVSAECGIRGWAGQAAACSVDGNDPELVHGTLQQAGDVPVVAQWQSSDRLPVHANPALSSGLLLLNDVAGDRGATIIFGLVPVHSHGLQTDVRHCGLLTLTRDSCMREGHGSAICQR